MKTPPSLARSSLRSGAVLLATIAVVLIPSSALADTTLSTRSAWNGSQSISSFGYQNTATYGQVIKGNGLRIKSFTFWIEQTSGGSFLFRPAVYGWNGARATTQLWLGSWTSFSAGSGYQETTATIPGGVKLSSGERYVILLTTSEGGSGSVATRWGSVPDSTYTGGQFVFLNNGSTNPLSTLTASDWSFISQDLAFTAVFGDEEVQHTGYCAVDGNTWPDGSAIPPGTFLQLISGQPKDDPHYTGAIPAIYVKDVGITCDPPPAGYTQQGYAGDELHVPGGVYPYYAPAP